MKVAWYRFIHVDEAPLLNIWVWQPISYPRWSRTSQLDCDANFSLPIPICSPSIFSFFLGWVLTYGKVPDLVEMCTRICSVIFPLIVSILVAEHHNTKSHFETAVVPSAAMPALPPSPVFICWIQSGSSRSSSVFQIFTWFFRFRT